MTKIYKGLVKRLLSQLEINIELDKATQLCNAFHAELSQGEAENKVIVDYDEKLKSFYINDNQPSTEALQGEPVGYIGDLKYTPFEVKKISRGKILDTDIPLYTAPPSTEDLQKDKAELIEYARKLYSKFDFIKGYAKDLEEAENEAKQALAIPQPKCME